MTENRIFNRLPRLDLSDILKKYKLTEFPSECYKLEVLSLIYITYCL